MLLGSENGEVCERPFLVVISMNRLALLCRLFIVLDRQYNVVFGGLVLSLLSFLLSTHACLPVVNDLISVDTVVVTNLLQTTLKSIFRALIQGTKSGRQQASSEASQVTGVVKVQRWIERTSGNKQPGAAVSSFHN